MLAVLSEVNLLKPIPPAGLRSLTARGRNRTFRAGGRQVCQGEVSACLQIIVRGCVRVERSHPLLVEPVILAEVGVGGVVGELGMLEGEPGGDTVTAVEDTETVELEAGAVAATLLQFPEASASLLGCLSHRLRTPDDLAEQMVRRGWRSPTLTQPGGRRPVRGRRPTSRDDVTRSAGASESYRWPDGRSRHVIASGSTRMVG